MTELGLDQPERLAELAPLVRRLVALDRRSVARLRLAGPTAALFATLPFRVLVGRAIGLADPVGDPVDLTVAAAELLGWLDGSVPEPPARRDADWRGPLPPQSGWQRLDVVPAEVVRHLVDRGAHALAEAAAREGVPGAQPRAEVADALLDSVVLTIADADRQAPVSLRLLSAATRMGFVPAGTAVAVDLSGRWTRVAAEYGSVYAEERGFALLR